MPLEINTLPLVGASTATPGYTRIQDQGTVNIAGVNGWNTGDALGNQMALQVLAASMIYNGSGWDRTRSASAANLIAQSGIGTALVAPPGNWNAISIPAVGALATATRAAGAAGVRHMYMGASLSASASGTPPTASILQVFVRDGTSGTGTAIDSCAIGIEGVAGWSSAPFITSQRSIPGSLATAMTAEANSPGANISEIAMISGYDVS